MAAGRPVARPALMLAALAALALSGGCSEVGAEFAEAFIEAIFEGVFEDLEVDGLRTSVGATTFWSVPEGMEKPDTHYGAEIDFHFANLCPPPHESIFGFGFGYFGDAHGSGLFTGKFFWDLGRAMSRAGGRDPWCWVVVRPELGFWVWSEAFPDESGDQSGPLTGISLGVAKWFPRGLDGPDPYIGVLGLIYNVERVNNVVGNGDATVGKLLLNYTWRW